MIDIIPERPSQGGPSRTALPGGKAGAAPKKSGGFAGYLVAGLIGGLTVAGGGYAVVKSGIGGLSLSDTGARGKIIALEERLASMELANRSQPRSGGAGAFESGSGGGGVNELRSRLDAMVGTVRGLDQTVQALAQTPGQAGQGGESREAVRAEIAAQTASLQQRLTSAERELEALVRMQTERQADARTASLTLALSNLKRAVADGRPFPAELAAVETLSPAKLPVSQLAAYKETGVSSMADLQSEFAEASKKTIEDHYGGKSSGFMGEMLNRAKSVVQIKPADSSGNGVEAILGRMTAAIKTGDLKTALMQGAALEHPPQEMMTWFGKAQARAVADEALRKTDQELLASLTKPVSRHP
jgi:hypothetical protein